MIQCNVHKTNKGSRLYNDTVQCS